MVKSTLEGGGDLDHRGRTGGGAGLFGEVAAQESLDLRRRHRRELVDRVFPGRREDADQAAGGIDGRTSGDAGVFGEGHEKAVVPGGAGAAGEGFEFYAED